MGSVFLASRGQPVYQYRVHTMPAETGNTDQHGRSRSSTGQCFYRTAVAQRQVRRDLPQRLPERLTAASSSGAVLPLLQPRTPAQRLRRAFAGTGSPRVGKGVRMSALQPDSVWIRRECFRCAKSVWESREQKLAGSLLTTAFPHSFTPYPHCAGAIKELTWRPFNNYDFNRNRIL